MPALSVERSYFGPATLAGSLARLEEESFTVISFYPLADPQPDCSASWGSEGEGRRLCSSPLPLTCPMASSPEEREKRLPPQPFNSSIARHRHCRSGRQCIRPRHWRGKRPCRRGPPACPCGH